MAQQTPPTLLVHYNTSLVAPMATGEYPGFLYACHKFPKNKV